MIWKSPPIDSLVGAYVLLKLISRSSSGFDKGTWRRTHYSTCSRRFRSWRRHTGVQDRRSARHRWHRVRHGEGDPHHTGIAVSTKEDQSCRQVAKEADVPDSKYFFVEFSILWRRSQLNSSTQNVVPISLWAMLTTHEYYSMISGHSGASQMCDTVRSSYCRRHIANDVYTYVGQCQNFRWDGKHRRINNFCSCIRRSGPLKLSQWTYSGPYQRWNPQQ